MPNDAISFAPRFSPDGSQIAFSMMLGANSDIYVAGASGGQARRLTTSPGVDTDPSFSPDGTKIVFESDRCGSQQLYVMNADGIGPAADQLRRRLPMRRPDWSPDGEWIAFTRREPGGRRIGIIGPDGTGERLLTNGPGDEGASWAASSRELIFQRDRRRGRFEPLPSLRSTAASRGAWPFRRAVRSRLVGSGGLMMRIILALAAIAAGTGAASAQIRAPGIVQRMIAGTRQPLRRSLPESTPCAPISLAQSGGTRSISEATASGLGAPARATLAAQAAWLRQHPDVVVRIEGHGDTGDTRDHALAVGARRAEEVRSYLVLLGVPAAQVTDDQLGQGAPGLAARRDRTGALVLSGAALIAAGGEPGTAPGAALRRFRERSSRARSRRGIAARGCSPTEPRD